MFTPFFTWKAITLGSPPKYETIRKIQLLRQAEQITKKFHWPQPLEDVLAISDPDIRFAMCILLVKSNREQKTGTDVMPLLEAAFQVALTENSDYNTRMNRFNEVFGLSRQYWDKEQTADRLARITQQLEAIFQAALAENDNYNNKIRLFDEVFGFSDRYSLWNNEQTKNRLAQYEASIVRVPGAISRFQCLHRMTWVMDQQSQDDAALWLDRLLVAVRDVQDTGYRLNAYLVTANQAVTYRLPERAKKIVDEALTFASTIPKQRLPVAQIAVPLQRLQTLRDQLQKKRP